MRTFSGESLACSFCNKSEKRVGKLIGSANDYPRVYICEECVSVYASIVEDDRAEVEAPSPMDVNHPLAERLIRAVEFWIKRESLGGDAIEELAKVRLIASQMLRE